MVRLKATKTSLYRLVAEYVDNLPPMRSGTQFIKYPRTPDYAMDWITPKWDKAHAFFSTCMGRPLLSIEIKDGETGKTVSREVYNLDLQDLRDRGMVERFVTAAGRTYTAPCGGSSSTSTRVGISTPWPLRCAGRSSKKVFRG